METISNLFREDLIFKSTAKTKEKVLTEIGKTLYEKGIVKQSFIKALVEREKEFPTGIDLAPVAAGLANVAIPHTDAKHCKDQVIVFVKLAQAVIFRNMMKPDEEMDVNYLFIIVNDRKTKQTNILSDLMGFMTNKENMQKLDTLESEAEIYEFLTSKKRGAK